jgi:hypothetical protein
MSLKNKFNITPHHTPEKTLYKLVEQGNPLTHYMTKEWFIALQQELNQTFPLGAETPDPPPHPAYRQRRRRVTEELQAIELEEQRDG